MGTGQPPSIPYPSDKAKRLAVLRRNDDYVMRRIFALDDEQARRLAQELRRANDNLAGALINAAGQFGGTWSGDDVNFRARTDALMQQIAREVDGLVRAAQDSTLNTMEQAYRGTYYGKAWALDNGLRTGRVVNLPMLQSQAIRSALLSPYGGSTFLDRFIDAREDFVRRIRKAIVQSQINGDSIPQAIKRLADELGINVGRGGAEKGLRARLEMIARTEILRASNLGAMAIYEANQDVLRGWEWIATKDERTCDVCGPRDGRVYAFGNAELPPAHPNCRCSVAPVLLDSEFEKRIVGPQVTWTEWKQAHYLSDTGI